MQIFNSIIAHLSCQTTNLLTTSLVYFKILSFIGTDIGGMMSKKLTILGLVGLLFASVVFAQESEEDEEKEYDDTQRAGDVLVVTLPLWTISSSLLSGDSEGGLMWFRSLGVNALLTFGLKKSTEKERPDKSDKESFPSAHASMTFHSAAYLHTRYGFQAAWFPYLAATFTAYSRVHSKKHFTEDVVAGAFIGSLSAYFLTDSTSQYSFIPDIGKNHIAFNLNAKF